MENVTLNFEPFASVLYREEHSEAAGRVLPKLSVQCIDAYGYQREWSLSLERAAGSVQCSWISHAYRHPGVRHIQPMEASKAKKLIARFLELCQKYPTLLFNDGPRPLTEGAMGNQNAVIGQPRAQGFVRFHTALLDGAEPTVRLLDNC